MTTNVIAVSNLIASAITQFFLQDSPIFNSANRKYEEMFKQTKYATGGAIQIKVPGYNVPQRGSTVTANAIDDLVVNYQFTDNDIYSDTKEVGVYQEIFDILGGDRALTANDQAAIVDNYGKPSYDVLEGAIEQTSAYELEYNAFYSPIDTIDKLGSINTFADISAITKLMNQLKMPKERYLMMNLTDSNNVSNSLQNSFNVALNTNISKNARVGGSDKGRLAGIDLYEATGLDYTHIAGTLALRSGMEVVSVGSDGLSIVINGVPADTTVQIKAGDRFSIPSVTWLANITMTVLSTKLTVVAAADTEGNGDGTITIPLNYPLLASGQHANVSALPVASAPVYCFPDHNNNFAYTPSGLNAAAVPMRDIHGAVNSNVNGNVKIPTKVYMQGAVLDLSNIFRISMLTAIKAITPYIISIPSAAV